MPKKHIPNDEIVRCKFTRDEVEDLIYCVNQTLLTDRQTAELLSLSFSLRKILHDHDKKAAEKGWRD